MTISPPGSPPGAPAAAAPRPRPTWSPGRVIAVVAACVFLLVGTGLLVGGAVLHVADGSLRDDRGFVMGDPSPWTSPGYAVRSESAEIPTGDSVLDLPARLLGTVTATAQPVSGRSTFVGVAHTADVNRYLRGVAHSTIHEYMHDSMHDGRGWSGPMTPYYDGGTPPMKPAAATFWAASASGPGEQTITWEPTGGSWTLVVMNADGSPRVDADVVFGAEVPGLDTLGTVLLVAGLAVVALSATGLWLSARQR